MRDVDEVHRPAHPLAEPAPAAHQLGHRAAERRALGNGVAVGAVTGVDGVVVAQLPAHGRGDTLAADGEVDETVDLVGTLERAHPLLEGPDAPHGGEEVTQDLRVHRDRGGHLAAAVLCPDTVASTTLRTPATILPTSGSTKSSIGFA